jgi:hypothetical protein
MSGLVMELREVRAYIDISSYWLKDKDGELRSVNSVYEEIKGSPDEVGRNTLRLALDGNLDRGYFLNAVNGLASKCLWGICSKLTKAIRILFLLISKLQMIDPQPPKPKSMLEQVRETLLAYYQINGEKITALRMPSLLLQTLVEDKQIISTAKMLRIDPIEALKRILGLKEIQIR